MRAASLLASIMVAGCAVVPPTPNYLPPERAVDSPALGQVQQAGVGEAMLTQGSVFAREVIFLPAVIRVSAYDLQEGFYRKAGESEDGDFFVPAGGTDGGAITPMAGAEAARFVLVRRDTGVLCAVSASDLRGCGRPNEFDKSPSAAGYERRVRTEPTPKPTRTLTYIGLVGRTLKVEYTERSAAAPQVSVATELDLNATTTLQVRGAQIEVIAATPASIQYRVLQSFRP